MAEEFERQPEAGQDRFSPLLDSGSPGLLRLEKTRLNPGEDPSHAQVDDAPGASGAVCEVLILLKLCDRTAAHGTAPGRRSDLAAPGSPLCPRNLRGGSKPGRQIQRVVAGPFSFRPLWHIRLVWHIEVVFIGAYENQPQRRHRQQKHDRTDQHAADDHRSERTLHLATDAG